MAPQLRPELCEHRKVRWNPVTVEPWKVVQCDDLPPSRHHERKAPQTVGHFLRQVGKCECGTWVVRLTEPVTFSPPRVLRSLVNGVDPR